MDDLDAHARAIIDANLYVTLGTADADGIPWVSPVYFATSDYDEFYWVSAQDATHSRNIETALPAAFDSGRSSGTGRSLATRSLTSPADQMVSTMRKRAAPLSMRA